MMEKECLDSKSRLVNERLKIADYVEWYFENEIPDVAMKAFLQAQIKKIGMDTMVDGYMDIVCVFRKTLGFLRNNVPSIEIQSFIIAKASGQGAVDTTPVQMLKIHMIDKLCGIDSMYCKRVGNDVKEGEFIEAVRFLGMFKQHYSLTRKHGERTYGLE